TVPPEMPRPNARSISAFQRWVSYIAGPVERRLLKSPSNGRLARYRTAPVSAPARTSAVTPTTTGRRYGTNAANPRPIRIGDRPRPSPHFASTARAAGRIKKVAAQQQRIHTPPITPKWRKPRNCVVKSEAYDTDAVSAAASVPPKLPCTAAPSAEIESSGAGVRLHS